MQMGRKAKDEKIKFYDQATDAADDVPSKEIISEMTSSSKDIVVFDCGLKSRETFEQFSQKDKNQLNDN